MATPARPIVIGIFRDRALADQAIAELRQAGFRDDEISVAGHAAPARGLLDRLVDTLVGQDTGQDAGADRLHEALRGKGVSGDEAIYYQHELEAGRALVLVKSSSHQQEARALLHSYGAYDVSARPPQVEGDRIIPLRQEELGVHKQLVETGQVVIRKEVITEQKTITVPITREELVIERRPGTGQPSEHLEKVSETLDEVLPDGGSVRIVLREEQVRVEKYSVVKEEVFISKRKIQEIIHLADTLKREEAHSERMGQVTIQGNEDVRDSTQDDLSR